MNDASGHPMVARSRLEISRPCLALGAEVSGVDLSKPMDDDHFAEVLQAFHDHLVLVFRDQALTPAAQISFAARFGPVEPHPLQARRSVAGHPGVLQLENRPGQRGARNDFWHSDISFMRNPPLASILHALEVPAGRGDTMFCNMYAALEAVSPGLRRVLDGLTALHSGKALAARNNDGASDGLPITEVPPSEEHPVVRTHPGTGRKALYINPYFVERLTDMTVAESRPLIDHLTQVAIRPENVFRHRWRKGDVVMWDNRCTMHYAVLDYGENEVRLMQRTTAGGERPA
jgi:taurine dioxygenase